MYWVFKKCFYLGKVEKKGKHIDSLNSFFKIGFEVQSIRTKDDYNSEHLM